PGTLILATANDYGGVTVVQQGALQAQHAQALGQGGGAGNGTVVRDGAAVEIQTPSGGASTVIPNEFLTLSGTGIVGKGALLNTSGNNVGQGPVTLDAAPNYSPPTASPGAVAIGVAAAGDTLTIEGAIGEALASGLRKVGPGTLVLSQANTYSGTTYVTSG